MSEQTCGHSSDTESTVYRVNTVNGDALSAVHFSGGASISVASGGAVASVVALCSRLRRQTCLFSLHHRQVCPGFPPGMPPPPPGMPPVAQGDPSSSRLPPEVLALKSQKWIQMQKKRYGQKRKGGYIDMGKQVRQTSSYFFPDLLLVCCIGYASRTCAQNHKGPRGYVQPQVQE